MEEKSKTSFFFLCKNNGFDFNYLNYVMKIKSKNLQTFIIMKKSPTYVPCLHHPKQMQDVKKI
jgi:hypothetical protein